MEGDLWPSVRDVAFFFSGEDGSTIQNVTSPCSMSPANTCDEVVVDGLKVVSPMIIPSCLCAALIGFTGFRNIRKHPNIRGSLSYALTFGMFGVMMTDAMINDSFLGPNGNPKSVVDIIIAVLDVGLTSSIALSFTFDGLVDVGAINQRSRKTAAAMLVSYASIFAAWLYCWTTGHLGLGFQYLYIYLIGVTCGAYCVLELVWLAKNLAWAPMKWVLLAGTSGGVGLAAIAVPSFMAWLCDSLGCMFSSMFVWFALTDVAMFSLYKYWMTRTTDPKLRVLFLDDYSADARGAAAVELSARQRLLEDYEDLGRSVSEAFVMAQPRHIQ